MAWRAELEGRTIAVTTTLKLDGEFEVRRHEVSGAAGLEALEGSAALGLASGEQAAKRILERGQVLRARSGCVASWNTGGFARITADSRFEETGRENVNTIYPRSMVNTLRAQCGEGLLTLRSVHFSSPAPPGDGELLRLAKRALALS